VAAGLREENLCLYEEIISSPAKALIAVKVRTVDLSGEPLKKVPRTPSKVEVSTIEDIGRKRANPYGLYYSRLKGLCRFGRHNPEKHRPATPVGASGMA
jgi:hypothetical protein